MIDDLTLLPSPNPPERSGKFKPRDAGMVIVPFIRDADEIMAKIVQRLLMAEGIDSSLLSWRNLRAKKIEHLKELKPRYLLFSVIDPRGVAAVAKKVEAVRSLIPELTLFVGLWSLPQSGAARVVAKINESTGADVYTNLDQAISSIASRINSADAQTGTRSPAT